MSRLIKMKSIFILLVNPSEELCKNQAKCLVVFSSTTRGLASRGGYPRDSALALYRNNLKHIVKTGGETYCVIDTANRNNINTIKTNTIIHFY